jgi:hypothetical protein
MSAALLEKILAERPKLHIGDTETKAVISARDTFLRGPILDGISKNLPGDYGLDSVVARFIYESVSEHSKTLETGAGISTLVFALRKSTHIAITPNASEVAAIQAYARTNQIHWSAYSLSSSLQIFISLAVQVRIWTSCSSTASMPFPGPLSIGFMQRIS